MTETVDSAADGRPSFRSAPVRMCVGCRGRAAKSELVRVVVAGDACVPDPTGHHTGRGAYLHLDQRCLELATRRRAFPRALRHPGPLGLDAVASYLEAAATRARQLNATNETGTADSSARPRARDREQVESSERSMSTNQ